eukprot:GHVR01053675.1.p1 GENE.GHVR01053675.1~~GHVR01053675.1.p1  ORF type:complete len:350 (+),score=106.50 GHVR01053675.1:82-1131(+)
MKAYVISRPMKEGESISDVMKLERLKMPVPKASEALVKVTAIGMCHSDCHIIKGGIPFPMPAVLGHEVCGTVQEFGPDVPEELKKRLKGEGVMVCAPFIMPCGACHDCVNGEEEICNIFYQSNRGKGGLHDGTTRYFKESDGTPVHVYSMGALAEYCVVPINCLFPIRKNKLGKLDPTHTCILGCAVFTAYGAVTNAAKLKMGESVAVIGAGGGVGSNIMQLSKLTQCYPRIAIDVGEDKLKACIEKFGATHTLDAAKLGDKLVEEVRKICSEAACVKGVQPPRDTVGVDCAIEAIGRAESVVGAVGMLRDGGRVVCVCYTSTHTYYLQTHILLTHLLLLNTHTHTDVK